MDVESYCDNLTIELTGWKAKIYDIMRKLDKLPSGDKGKILGNVNDLHVLVEEMDDRIERLRNQCPSDWSPDKVELETKLTRISDICQDCSNDITASYG
jgi:hypothetical protein